MTLWMNAELRDLYGFDYFGIVDIFHSTDAKTRISDWYGTRLSDSSWLSNWWMKL
jgi:hypothetical protein